MNEWTSRWMNETQEEKSLRLYYSVKDLDALGSHETKCRKVTGEKSHPLERFASVQCLLPCSELPHTSKYLIMGIVIIKAIIHFWTLYVWNAWKGFVWFFLFFESWDAQSLSLMSWCPPTAYRHSQVLTSPNFRVSTTVWAFSIRNKECRRYRKEIGLNCPICKMETKNNYLGNLWGLNFLT